MRRGAQEGFAQLNLGRVRALARIRLGDGRIYFSPKERFGERAPCQRFTAIGRVTGEVYRVELAAGFAPYRRDADYVLPVHEAPIWPMLEALGFVTDPRRRGYAFRYGHLEIPRADFERIARAMLGTVPAF